MKNITHYPRHRKTVYDNRVGEKKIMKCGLVATILKYYDRHDISVQIGNYVVHKRTYTAFCKGDISPEKVQVRYKETIV